MLKNYFQTIIIGVLGIVILFIAIFFFLTNQTEQTHADATDNVYGWAWSGNFGWISLNCFNYYNNNLEDHCENSDFGVNINNSTHNVEGYAWSSSLGWIDFDVAEGYPQAPTHSVQVDANGFINGWAQTLAMKDYGWINFRGKDCSSGNCLVGGSAPEYQLDNTISDGQSSMCYNCDRYKRTCQGGNLNGNTCNVDADCGDAGSCTGEYKLDPNGELFCSLCFSGHMPESCLESDDPTCTHGDKYPAGNVCGKDASLAQTENFMCSGCQEYNATAPNQDEKIIVCSSCPVCYEYGVGVNQETNRMAGWAWNGNSNGSGFGWLQFNPTYTVVHGPWLETEFGGIYSKGSVGSQLTYAPPGEQFSAMYEIQAGGSITHFSSQAGDDFTREEFTHLQFPSNNNVYSNALGRIDFNGIYAGQYGKVEPITFATDIPSQLGGKIYHSLGDLTIDQSMQIAEGTLDEPNGAGTVLVEGDLYINNNITYSNLSINKISYLPSIAWIVKGDVIISGDVRHVAGAFVILGDGNGEKCPNLHSVSQGCGRLEIQKSSEPLDLSGLVIARQFKLGRTYFSVERGAERFVYDGRALANTPPGLGDLGQVLPVWQEVAP